MYLLDTSNVVCYNTNMEICKQTKNTVSLVKYHFVFCPRYRRKIFLIPFIEDRFKELVTQVCNEHTIDILNCKCHSDHVYLFVHAPPSISPSDIMQYVKGGTSRVLREEFSVLSAMPGLWTRNYFVSTAETISNDTIQKYVETQKYKP